MAGVEILGFVNKHVIKHAFRAGTVFHNVCRHRRRGRISQPGNRRAPSVEVLHNRPHCLALRPGQRRSPAGAARTQVGFFILDSLRQNHSGVLLRKECRVGLLSW